MSSPRPDVSPATSLFTLVGAWSAFAYAILAMLGWWVIAGYWPMIGPAEGADTIANFYQNDNLLGKRIGLIIVMWAAVPMMLLTAGIAGQITRIEGRAGPLTYCALIGGFATAILTFYPPMWWLTAAFRPERSAEMLHLLNDAAWLQFVGGISMAEVIYIGVALAAFIDKSEQPIFPRWSGYASLWVLALLLPGQLLFMFKTGPFAWNGLFGFWVPGVAFFSWFIMMGILMLKHYKRERAEALAAR